MNRANSRTTNLKGSSDRVFGCVMAVFFAVIGLMPLYSGHAMREWALWVAAPFLVLALIFPRSLARLNRGWMYLGFLLSAVVSPIALGIVFFGVITPFGLILRLFGKRLMPLHFDPKANSYWIARQPPGPDPQTMRNSF
jgi:hypothetical protein